MNCTTVVSTASGASSRALDSAFLSLPAGSSLADNVVLRAASAVDFFPNVVAEALASGCCVLATDSPGGTAELLDNGAYGKLVPPDDIESLASGLDALLGNAHKRESYAQRAPDAVRSISVNTIADKWIDLFSEFVSRNHA